MKISIIPDFSRIETLFSEKDLQALSKFGDVFLNKEREAPDEEIVKQLIKNADVVITSWGCPMLTGDILDAAPGLKLVIHAAGSVKSIVSPEIWEKGIRIISCAEPLAKGVAETTLGFIISSLKSMWLLNQNVRNGEWEKDKENIRELYDITVGIIGASRVGRHLIRLLHNFDVEMLVYDPYLTEERAFELGVVKTSLEELLAKSDVVTVHAPQLPETNRMLDREKLALLKDRAVLINTARGSIIDEKALANELMRRNIYACIDVTDPEPPAKENILRSLPNVVMTPHIAGLGGNGLKRIGRYAVEELRKYLEGSSLDGEVHSFMLNYIA